MNRVSRREFIVGSAAGMLALRAGGSWATGVFAAEEQKPADMAIARWKGPKELPETELRKVAARLTEKAIEAVGGLGRFVKRGDVVWVKPNIGWDRRPETAANTNPDVVATIVRLCFQAGAKTVKVGDNPVDQAVRTYPSSGIPDAVRELGADVVFLDRNRFRETAIGGEALKRIPVYPDIMESDLVINVPVAKHHRLTEVTLCMKNYLGVIEKRQLIHQNFGPTMADLTRFMKPRICVLDAVRTLPRNGPRGGNLADVEFVGTVAAGVDIVALDALGAELLGRNPAEIKSIVAGQRAGLGRIDYRSLALREITLT
ncbi:MAG: DUF362 domain-containing protein [Thermoguttaceae bacterium]